jgi:hypothetical protein
VAVLVIQSGALAQTSASLHDDWNKVLSRTPGETLIVTLKDGNKVQGALQHGSADSVVLTRGNQERDVKRDDIASVAVLGQKKSAVKPTLIGLAVGAGVGAGIGAAANGNESGQSFVLTTGQERALGAAVGGVIGAVGGSVIGYFVGRHRRTQALIYAPPKAQSTLAP